MSFTLIETKEDLFFLNKELLQRKFVGVDTEFRRTTKDNMKLALIQINDSEEIYLIDALLIDDPQDKCSFLFSDSVTKIFHSCREDIEAINSWTNLDVLKIYDTQTANSLLGGSFSLSYQDLVKDKFDLKISKDETRTNWLRRPLTEPQLNYAASDVYFLVDLYKQQMAELIESNKLKWLEEELNNPPKRDSKELHSKRAFVITKKEEKEILKKFDVIVKTTSKREDINHTLFFSKQSQKTLLGSTLFVGVQNAMKSITDWRKDLIKEPYSVLMKEFGIY